MYASFFCSLQSVFVYVNVTIERCCYLDLGGKKKKVFAIWKFLQ